ncbi:uncharacterized protein ACWYII_004664 [Salvelinus alpinus]
MRILLIVILLSFLTDDCCGKSVIETANLGGEATIRCNYPEDHEDSIKYFCRESNDFKTCVNMISAHQTTVEAGRFSVSDNRRERFSTVTIRDLTEDDTGTYWCGVETSRTEQRYITLITQVKLDVIKFVVIMVSVSLAVLVFTVILFTVYRWKCNKVQGSVSSSRQTSSRPNIHPGNSEERDQDYENDPATDTMVYIGKDDAVYQTLNPNAANQDPTYHTLNPNTANQDPTYQTLNPNTANQDSTYQTLNPNTANQDPTYQTLNPNTVNQDPTYHTLNPNTANQDPTYQTLNPNAANQV